MQNIKIFACSKSAEDFTKEVCSCLKLPIGKLDIMKFKNDNTFVQYPETVRAQDIYLIQTTHPPVNERVMELLMSIDAAKRAGAGRINVILPYYLYSRSDKKDQPRIPITAKLMAQIIEAAGASRVVTCDLHNPSIQAYFNVQCDRVTAKNLLTAYFLEKGIKNNMVIVSPDAGSAKKAYRYSHAFECPIALIDKRREGNDDKAKAVTIIGDVKGKSAVIFDDEVSTAGTLCEAADIVMDFGAKEVYAGITHGILCGPAIERIQKSGIKELVVTNTIPVPEEKRIDKIKIVSIAPLFAEAIRRVNEAKPLGDLFDL